MLQNNTILQLTMIDCSNSVILCNSIDNIGLQNVAPNRDCINNKLIGNTVLGGITLDTGVNHNIVMANGGHSGSGSGWDGVTDRGTGNLVVNNLPAA